MKRVYMVPHGLIFCVQRGIRLRIILLSVRGVKNALEKLKKGVNIQNSGYIYKLPINRSSGRHIN